MVSLADHQQYVPIVAIANLLAWAYGKERFSEKKPLKIQ
ncbi:hypothetical protein H1P_850014 [Hyella patelloides LEGE 07179]|uniref:Uncharacterized protein n=1 Tax=Hyella patelloides LEGE 07179 TaxID=945734 RepID=A0A563W4U3_9CYAN|nr:hypothetical protein H1P_850014 [Hyella patelloides LEGE 07179]